MGQQIGTEADKLFILIEGSVGVEAGFIGFPQAVLIGLRGSLWLQKGVKAVELSILIEGIVEAKAGSGGSKHGMIVVAFSGDNVAADGRRGG